MDKEIKEWERRMFSADVVSGFLCELSRAIDYSYTRMLRAEDGDFKNAAAMMKENADWLKNILPRYIDSEAERLISLRNSDVIEKNTAERSEGLAIKRNFLQIRI